MQRTCKQIRGVTLLEIMLVLSVAAMIIVMSIRYYQTAEMNRQANMFVAQINAIAAAVDSIATGSGGSFRNVSQSSVEALLPEGAMKTPWGGGIRIGNINNANDQGDWFHMYIDDVPAGICKLARSKLESNPMFDFGHAGGTGCSNITFSQTGWDRTYHTGGSIGD